MRVQVVDEEGSITRTVFNVRAIHPWTKDGQPDGFELVMEFSDTPVMVRSKRTLRVLEDEAEQL